MFDTYSIPFTTSTSYLSVTEKRAPTDESVRLLKEFEQAAKDKVINAQQLDNNLISATLWQMQDPLTYKDNYKILVKINGKTVTVDVAVDHDRSREQKADAVYEALSKNIAAHLMDQIYKDVR
jgi:hypothetical protein